MIVPTGLFAHDPEGVFAFCLAEQVHRDVLDDSEVGGRMIFSYPAIVISEGYIEHPVKSVFNSPM